MELWRNHTDFYPCEMPPVCSRKLQICATVPMANEYKFPASSPALTHLSNLIQLLSSPLYTIIGISTQLILQLVNFEMWRNLTFFISLTVTLISRIYITLMLVMSLSHPPFH